MKQGKYNFDNEADDNSATLKKKLCTTLTQIYTRGMHQIIL